MTDAVDRAFQALRLEYLASLPERLQELRSDLEAFRAGQPGSDVALKGRLHRLAGSGGSYGFVHQSSIAREAEQWLASHLAPAETDPLVAMVERLAQAVEEAGQRGSGAAGT